MTSSLISNLSQIIQTVSAADRDLSPAGQQFSFRLPPEAAIRPNFTVHDFRSKYKHLQTHLLRNFVTGHTGMIQLLRLETVFQRIDKTAYFLYKGLLVI